jgi:hypothetical protein
MESGTFARDPSRIECWALSWHISPVLRRARSDSASCELPLLVQGSYQARADLRDEGLSIKAAQPIEYVSFEGA